MQTERGEGNVHVQSLAKKLSDKEGTKAKLTLAWRAKGEVGVVHVTLCFGRQSVCNSKPSSEKNPYCPFKDFSYTHVMGSLSLFHTAVRFKV